MMSAEQALIDSFRASEHRHSGLATADAADAEQAKLRIRAHLEAMSGAPDIQQFRCSMKNDLEAIVFHALLKRYGIIPYRYGKQRKSTILVRVSAGFMNGVLWPIFNDVRAALDAEFTKLATSVLPAIAPGPFTLAILNHDHRSGQLCEDCRRRLLEEK